MKKIISFILMALFVLSLTACGNKSDTAKTTSSNSSSGKSSVTFVDNTPKATQSVPEVKTIDESSEASDDNTSESTKDDTAKTETAKLAKPDIDLSAVGSNVIYSKANEIASNYTNYLGKIIKIKGNFQMQKAETRNYYFCSVSDPTACCSAGFEFILKDTSLQYPTGYPAENAEFVVQGKLHSYKEGDTTYLELIDATII